MQLLKNITEFIRTLTNSHHKNCKVVSPDLLEKVLDGIPDVVGVYNTDHSILFYNKAGYDFYSKTAKDIKGKKCYEMLFRDQKCPGCPVDRAICSKAIVRKERYLSDLNVYMDYCCNPVLDENGKVMFVVELLRDISDKKKLEEVLKEAGKNYRKIVNLSPDAIVITINGIIELANHQAMEMLGEPIGGNIESYYLPEYIMRTRKGREYILKNRANKFLADCRMRRKDGRIADVQISSSYFNYKGKDAVLLLIRDVSEKNKELNAAAQLQRLDFAKPFPIPEKVMMEKVYMPAKFISGDFYYFHRVNENLVVGMLGDICGKSFKAALGISAFNVLFHEAVLRYQKPDEILKLLNRKIPYYFDENYIAAVCFSFNFEKQEADIAGAGIGQFVVQRKDGEAELHTVAGSYLGMFENSEFEMQKERFNPGDRFCFFSDGLDSTIVEDSVNEIFTKEKSLAGQKVFIENQINEMLSEVDGYKDDCTLLLFEMR